ncbi:MAG: AAA family ATPase [Candidatus Yanofskybacteria bacterium]|nr:AAA family ATPase [Candidatus Yanofskybacteria bacterium]
MIKQEIERRFLVKKINLPLMLSCEDGCKKIQQGYLELPEQTKSFRVRLASEGKSILATATIKTGSGLVREEGQFKIDRLFAEHLLMACHHHLTKTRHKVNGWEVDFYDEPLKGIIIAEKELASADEKVELPPWIMEATEVTDKLSNLHLARLASELRGINGQIALNHTRELQKDICRMAIIGPPCSGKSSILEIFKKKRPEIYFIPETASMVIHQLGIKPSGDRVANRRFQLTVYQTQKNFETLSIQFAKLENKKAIAVDRGTLDNAAYLNGGLKEFLSFFKTSVEQEYARYDAVIYLGPPPKHIFEKDRLKNPARYEKNYEEIAQRHRELFRLWSKHPAFFYIGSKLNWEEKVDEVRSIIKNILSKGGRQ